MFDSVPIYMMVIGFFLMLGPLVLLHELGHYIVGRLCGVKADAFSIGFGKELAGHTDRRGTRWKLSLLPFGGYVQFKGDMNPASKPDPDLSPDDLEGAFQTRPLWQRALIVAAGPVTNFLIAVFIFAGFAMVYGAPAQSGPGALRIAAFTQHSAAEAAGMHVGDSILAIDGDKVHNYDQVVRHILLFPDRTVTIAFDRNGKRLSVPVKIGSDVETDQFGNTMRAGRIGVAFAPPDLVPVGPVRAVAVGFDQTRATLSMMVTAIEQIVVGDRSVKELGGPITMAKFSGEQLSLGPKDFVYFVAFISINLAFINLLPIPVLDGGHLAFYAVEAIRRKPASQRSQELAFRTGMAFVLALMLFVTMIDIAKLPIFGT